MTMTTSKYRPIMKPELHRPLAPSVTCGDSSLPEGAMGCIPFHIGLCLWKVPAVQSLSHASGVPAPFDKGAFGCTADTGRVRVVTNCKKPPCALTAAARRNTSLREGGGLGRSPKTEGASGRTASWIARYGTSPNLSHFLCPLEATTR